MNQPPDSFKIGGAVALTFWLLGIWPFGQRVNVTQNVTIHVTKDQKVTTKKTGNDVDVEVTSNRRIDWENNNSSIHTLAAAYMAGHQAGLKKCLVPPYEMLGRNVPRRIKG